MKKRKGLSGEDRYRLIADFTYDWEYWRNPEGGFEYVSPSCEGITGYPPQAFIDDPQLYYGIIHPDDIEKVREYRCHPGGSCMERGRQLEFRIIRKDGTERWIGHYCQEIFGGEGNSLGRRGSNRDITDRKREEAESERFFTLSTEMLATASAVDSRWKRVNRAMCRTLGWSEEELLQTSFYEIVHPEDLSGTADAAARLERGQRLAHFENRIRRRDGTYRWIAWEATYDPERALFYCAARDITRSRKMHQALRESEHFSRKIIQSTLAGVYIHDLQKAKNIYINPVYEKITGYSLKRIKELGPKGFLKLFHPEDRDRVVKHIQGFQSASHAGVKEIEYRFRHADGHWIWCLSRDTFFQRDEKGRPSQMIGSFVEITDLKRAQETLRRSRDELEERVAERTLELKESNLQLQRRSEQLSRLASALTLAEQRERRRISEILHDHLQQLLVAIRMHASQIPKPEDLPDHREKLERIDEILGEAIATTRSLTMDLSPPILYREGLAPALQWLARDFAEKQRLPVQVHISSEIEGLSESLEVFLYRSARELLFNAVKHARTSHAILSLFQKEGDILLEVKDPGRGFDPDAIFKEADAGGFGLFSIRERAESLGGEMHISSRKNMGSCFLVRVPLERSGES